MHAAFAFGRLELGRAQAASGFEGGARVTERPVHAVFVRLKPHDIIQCYAVLEEGSARAFNIWDTAFTPDTLTAELRGEGFEPLGFYADMEGNAYSEASDTLCAVVELRE